MNTLERTGLLKITVQAGGAFTGSIIVGGAAFPLRGFFGGDGGARFGAEGVTALELVHCKDGAGMLLGALALSLQDTAHCF